MLAFKPNNENTHIYIYIYIFFLFFFGGEGGLYVSRTRCMEVE